eukprot:216978_1
MSRSRKRNRAKKRDYSFSATSQSKKVVLEHMRSKTKYHLYVDGNETAFTLQDLIAEEFDADTHSLRLLHDGSHVALSDNIDHILEYDGPNDESKQNDLIIDVMTEQRGGGGLGTCSFGGIPCVRGPDLNGTKHIIHFDRNAPEERRLCYGVSIEFEYENRYIIGHIGDNKKKHFHMNKSWKNALCPSLKVKCKTFGSIKKIYFCGCTVTFTWGTANDETEYERTVKFGPKCYYYSGEAEYLYLEMKITINDNDNETDDEQFDDNDSEYECPMIDQPPNKKMKYNLRKQRKR